MAEEKKFNKKSYDIEFHKKNYVNAVAFKVRRSETEILEKLASVPNKNDYIRQLILADIQKEKEANK